MHYLVADIARTITLVPGDLLFTGTPANSRPVEPGDVVEVEVEGLGRLTNHVVEGPTPGPRRRRRAAELQRRGRLDRARRRLGVPRRADAVQGPVPQPRRHRQRGAEVIKVVVDRDVCQNHGQCVFSAPQVFELDDDGRARAAAGRGRRGPARGRRGGRRRLPGAGDHDRGLTRHGAAGGGRRGRHGGPANGRGAARRRATPVRSSCSATSRTRRTAGRRCRRRHWPASWRTSGSPSGCARPPRTSSGGSARASPGPTWRPAASSSTTGGRSGSTHSSPRPASPPAGWPCRGRRRSPRPGGTSCAPSTTPSPCVPSWGPGCAWSSSAPASSAARSPRPRAAWAARSPAWRSTRCR